jgi:hypothetical protein
MEFLNIARLGELSSSPPRKFDFDPSNETRSDSGWEEACDASKGVDPLELLLASLFFLEEFYLSLNVIH